MALNLGDLQLSRAGRIEHARRGQRIAPRSRKMVNNAG